MGFLEDIGAAFKHMGNNAAALLPMQKAAVLMPDDAASHGNLAWPSRIWAGSMRPQTSFRGRRRSSLIREARPQPGKNLKELGRLDEAEAVPACAANPSRLCCSAF